jgi:hypothetical protein
LGTTEPGETNPGTDTGTADFPDHTQAPGTEYVPDHNYAFSPDATSAPEIGQAEEIQGTFAESPSALLDKYVFSRFHKESIVFLVPLIPIFWIFIQDNGAGRLQTREGVISFFIKSGIALGICLLALLLALLYGFTRRRT